MQFIDLVRRRYSVRAYLDKEVSKDTVLNVLETARWAPSACNNQPWHFVVVTDRAVKDALKLAYGREWFASAPVIIAACLDTQACWHRADGKSYGDVDVAIIMDHLTLAAAEAGLGTCWIGAFKPDPVRAACDLPRHLEPLIMTPLGYPASVPPEKKRRSLEEMVSWERYRTGGQ